MAGCMASYFVFKRDISYIDTKHGYIPLCLSYISSALIEQRGGGKKLVTDCDSSAASETVIQTSALKKLLLTPWLDTIYLFIYLFIISFPHPRWKVTSREYTLQYL